MIQRVSCLESFGLATAEITYRRPDHAWLLQQYIWQDYDLAPDFPELHKFLQFWRHHLDGPLVQVTVAHQRLLTPHVFKI